MLYATPWSLEKGYDYYFNNLGGLYSWLIGYNHNQRTRAKDLKHLKEYTSEERYKRYEGAVYRTKSGLADFDKDIYVPMFGYKDVMDYYKQASLDRLLDKIAVPTLTLDGRDDMICD